MKVLRAVPGLLGLILLVPLCRGFCTGCYQGATGQFEEKREREDRFARGRYYSRVPLSRGHQEFDEVARVQPSGLTNESCEQITSLLSKQEKVREHFSATYLGKRVKWRARVVDVDLYDLSPGARKQYGYDRPMRGAILHFFCNPDNFTEKTVQADGIMLFNGDELDRDVLKGYRKGDPIEIEGVLASVFVGMHSRYVGLFGTSFKPLPEPLPSGKRGAVADGLQ